MTNPSCCFQQFSCLLKLGTGIVTILHAPDLYSQEISESNWHVRRNWTRKIRRLEGENREHNYSQTNDAVGGHIDAHFRSGRARRGYGARQGTRPAEEGREVQEWSQRQRRTL